MKARAKTSENTRRNFVAKHAKVSGAGFHSGAKSDIERNRKIAKRIAKGLVKEFYEFRKVYER